MNKPLKTKEICIPAMHLYKTNAVIVHITIQKCQCELQYYKIGKQVYNNLGEVAEEIFRLTQNKYSIITETQLKALIKSKLKMHISDLELMELKQFVNYAKTIPDSKEVAKLTHDYIM